MVFWYSHEFLFSWLWANLGQFFKVQRTGVLQVEQVEILLPYSQESRWRFRLALYHKLNFASLSTRIPFPYHA